MRWRFVQVVVVGLGLLAGCDRPVQDPKSSRPSEQTSAPPSAPKPSDPVPHLDHAQPKLRTVKLWLGAEELEAEVALRPVEVATGMMFRESMGENEAMLFVFVRPYRTSFYMKNTTVRLSAAYIDPEGVIQEIHDLEPLKEEPVTAESDQIQYVLEVKRGWFDRHGIGIGTLVTTELGPLRDVFQRR